VAGNPRNRRQEAAGGSFGVSGAVKTAAAGRYFLSAAEQCVTNAKGVANTGPTSMQKCCSHCRPPLREIPKLLSTMFCVL